MTQNFYSGGRNSRAGYSPAMGPGDPRLRRNAMSGRTGDDLGDGLALDLNGRQAVQVDEASGLMVDNQGRISLDHSKLAQQIQNTTFSTTVVGGGGGGGGGTTVVNNFFTVDEVLPWIDW